MQDSKGYMWFCTDAGVSRYDGYRFRNFSTENGIPDNTIFGSYEDWKGRIWFRSMSGKLSYFLNDSVYAIPANRKLSGLIQNALLTNLYVDKGDTLWCGIASGTMGYYKISPPYREQDFQVVPLTRNSIYLMEIDNDGFIWGTVSDAKNIFGHKKARDFMHLNKKGRYLGLFPAPLGISPNTRIVKQGPGKFVITGLLDVVFVNGESKQLWKTGVYPIALYEDRSKQLWVGNYQQGVSLLRKREGVYSDSIKYLPGLSVSGIWEDREGGYWFTTLENGVYYLASGGLLYYDHTAGLKSNKVFGLLVMDSVSVLAGTSEGGLSRVSLSGISEFDHPPINTFYKLDRGPDSSVLVGCVSSFLIPHSGHKNVPILASGTEISIKCFSYNRKGDLWGGNYYLLVKIDPRTGIITQSVKASSRVISIYCDDDGSVWLGCTNGLWEYRDSVFSYAGTTEPLFRNRIEDIKVGPDGTWWFATKGAGLILKKNGKVTRLTQEEGLTSNAVKSICIDKEGVVWTGTNKGIDRITLRREGNYKIEKYSMEDGLISNEVNQVVRGGEYLWAATSQGIAYFHIRNSSSNTTPPPIYLTEVTVNREKKDFRVPLRLTYDQNFIGLQYIGLAYKRSSELRYKYRLLGLDTSWNYTTNTAIQYTTLPYGDYTFQVYAINNDGMGSTAPASVRFHIAKPLWLEHWFIALVALTLLTGLYLLYKQRIRVLRNRLIKTAEINRRISEIELKALRAQMNPHFIFNCIASIQNFILKNDSDSANKYLSKFSKLIRQVLTNSTQEYISMEVEIRTLELYIELERMRFQSKFNYQIIIDKELEVQDVFMPPLIIQPYVENAIWHGLMHLQNRAGMLVFKIEKEGEFLKCTIEDNGIGRKKSVEIKAQANPRHRSVGLSITRERLENINAIYQSNLTVEFKDKIGKKGEAEGTIVELFIPCNINKLS